MRGSVRTALLAISLAIVPAAAAAGSGQVWVSNCKHERYKPSKLVIACGDGSEYLTKMNWSSWSTSKASGKGTLHVNSCTPSCAGGTFSTYKVKVDLSKPKSCSGQKYEVFDTAKLTFGSSHPSGQRKKQKVTLGCPI